MNENLAVVIRHVLVLAGSFLVGKNIFGIPADESTIQGIVGIVMTLIGLVWSIANKSVTEEMIEGAGRHLVELIGALLVGSGKVTMETWQGWATLIGSLLPILLSFVARKKVEDLRAGYIQPQQLRGLSGQIDPIPMGSRRRKKSA